jgi:hypothetical protein
MTTKKKNDNPNLLKRNALIISIAFNILLVAMFLLLYVPTLAPPPPTPNPFQLTATRLIATATEGEMTRIATTAIPSSTFAIPTLSTEDETVLREQFLNELETELGFLHPDLEGTVDRYIDSMRYEIERHNESGFGATNIPENFIQDMDRTTFENVEYVAVVIPFDNAVAATYGFIFRFENGKPEFLARTDVGITLERFDDRNGNGFPDVALKWSSCGSSCTYGMNVYEVRSNGEFVNLTENLNAMLDDFVDLDGDGILELAGTQQIFIPEGVDQDNSKFYDRIPRWFFWNGDEYEPYPVIAGE